MTTAVESFLVLEKSLANRIFRQWQRDTDAVLNEIIAHVDRGEFARAIDLCPDLSMAETANNNLRYTEFIGMQATLFGASRLAQGHPSRTHFVNESQPEAVSQASEAMVDMLGGEGTEDVCRVANELISEERVAQQDETYKSDEQVRRDATTGFIRKFQTSVRGNGKAFINLGSSLHTSRLSAWGFTQEAQFRGISQYQVSEQLDGRTCPVCRTMHGRKFAVAPAANKLQNWLSVKNMAEPKGVAPWPKQDKKSVARLSKMSRSAVQSNGWDTPPYHPLCRGVLVPAGSVPEKLPIDDPLVPSFIDDEEILQSVREEIEDLAAQAVGQATAADIFVTPQIVGIAEEVGAIFPAAAAPGAPAFAEEVVEGSLRYYRLKGKGSSARKILTYQEKFNLANPTLAAERLSDSLRYTFIIDDANYVAGIRKTMEKFADLGYRNGKFDAAWFTRPDYKGVNINLVTPQGVKMELQFHTSQSFNVKQILNHPLYEEYRTLTKAQKKGAKGRSILKEMADNADTIDIPPFIEQLEELAQLYNGTS